MKSFFRSISVLVSTSVRVAPIAALGCLAETAGVLLSLLQPWAIAWFIGGAAVFSLQQMATAAGVFVAQLALVRVLFLIGMNARLNQLERVGAAFAADIARLTASVPTIDHLDDPKHLDQRQILHQNQGAIGLAVNTLLNQLNTMVGVIGVLVLASTADPRMLLVAAAGVPTVLIAPLIARWRRQTEEASAEPGRRAQALLAIGTNPNHLGEISILGLADGLRSRMRTAAHQWRQPMIRLAARETAATAATSIVFYGTAVTVIALLVNDTITGIRTLTDLTLALLLVTRLQGVSDEMRNIITELATMTRTAERFLWLRGITQKLNQRTGHDQAPDRPGHLCLDNVTYRYLGAKRDTLANITLDLAPGTVLAVVGENGAGKTTLAELLAGLRTPSHGTITFGSTDLAKVDPAHWHTKLSGAFQDHVKFEMHLGTTVGIGDLARHHDHAAIEHAVAAGAADSVVAATAEGYATQLGTRWPDGIELSGGQWQRLAIARGMMRTTPHIRILDEPTSALDPVTEHQLFNRYAEAARQGRQDGTITILITHRFSTTATADLIAVLEHGHLTEIGTHRELITTNGTYAQLYQLQASGYNHQPDLTH